MFSRFFSLISYKDPYYLNPFYYDHLSFYSKKSRVEFNNYFSGDCPFIKKKFIESHCRFSKREIYENAHWEDLKIFARNKYNHEQFIFESEKVIKKWFIRMLENTDNIEMMGQIAEQMDKFT